jgi:hypothetical protein
MGKTAKTFGIIAAVILVLFVARIGLSMANRPDDQKLIENALAEAVEASKEGKPGGVIDLLSNNLKVNDQDVGGNNRQVADFVRQWKPNARVLEPKAQITGDEGRIVSPVELEMLNMKRTLNEVTLIFRKEDATEYLFIPVAKWRLTEVRVPDTSLAEFMQQ